VFVSTTCNTECSPVGINESVAPEKPSQPTAKVTIITATDHHSPLPVLLQTAAANNTYNTSDSFARISYNYQKNLQ